jgi:cytoskeletal protein CcmA (bactofilin family)
MWKGNKPEEEKRAHATQHVTQKEETPIPIWEEKNPKEPRFEPKPAPAKEETINIGKLISIKGELSGDEDFTIDGRVEGKIELKDHDLVIGPHGEVTAEIHAKNVIIDGRVIGNVLARELVEIKASGFLVGNIESSRISIVDGAHFKGRVNLRKGVETGNRPCPSQPEPVKVESGQAALADRY